MLDTYQVLEQIAYYWDDMTQAEQSNLALMLGMKTQIEVFTSVVGNFETAQNALTTALNSQGSAWQENEKYMQGIQAKTQALKTQFEELATGDGTLSKLVKLTLDLGIAILKILNSDWAKWFTVLSLAVVGCSIAMKTFNSTVKNFTSVGGNAVDVLVHLITKIVELTATSKAFNIALKATVAGLAIGLVAGLATFISKIIVTKKELKELRSELDNTFSSQQSELEGLTQQLESLNDSLSELNKEKQNSTLSDFQIASLDTEISKYEDQIDLLKEKIRLQQIAMQNTAKESYETDVTGMVDTGTFTTTDGSLDGSGKRSVNFAEEKGSLTDIFNREIESAQKYVSEIERLSQQRKVAQNELLYGNVGADKQRELEEVINQTTRDLVTYSEALDTVRAGLFEHAQIVQTNIDVGNEVNQTDKENIENYNNLLPIFNDLDNETRSYSDSLSLIAEAYNLDKDELDAFIQANDEYTDNIEEGAIALAKEKGLLEDTAEEVESLSDVFADSLKSITEVSDAYDALSSAIEEYNETGQLSAKTMTELVEKYPDYLQYLVDENGQLSINEDGMLALANARIDDAEALAYRQAMAELDTIAMQDNNTEVENSESASQTFKSATQSDINELNQIIQALNDGTYAWQRYNYEKTQGMTTYQKSQYEGVMNNLADQIKVLEKARNSLGSYSKSTSKAGSSSSKASKEVDKLTESINNLESEIKKFEDTIKYIDGKFDDVIDDLKDAKDKVLDGIDDQIDALKDLADEADDAYEAQITALENKRDAELAIIDEEISALEDENDALQRQYELQELLDNLAKAKSSKVKLYQNGSFGYSQDVEQVAGAQNELSEWTTKQALQAKIDALNNYRDTVVANYKQQISAIEQLQASTKASYEKQVKDLENYKDAMEKQYDAQIENWENQKKEFNTLVDSYETEQNRLQALELTGIDFENESWKTRISNLSDFVTTYTSLLKQLADAKKAEASGGDVSVSSGASYSGSSSSSVSTTSTSTTKSLPKVATTGTAKIINNAKKKGMTAYASGSSYIKADQMAIVGEDPYREIVIGSKLNNGVVTNLQKGSGVIPATTTSKLIEMANTSYYSGSNHTLNDVTNTGGETINMNIDNVQVRANNADEFVASMKEFKLGMTQKAYTR